MKDKTLFDDAVDERNSETYEFNDVECHNCRDEFENFNIPKGTTIEEFLYDKICDTCGCKSLTRNDE